MLIATGRSVFLLVGNVNITFYLKDNAQKTRIYFYNEVAELLKVITINGAGQQGTSAGYNEVAWDMLDKFQKELSNGIYLFVIVVEGEGKQTSAKGKLVILRR